MDILGDRTCMSMREQASRPEEQECLAAHDFGVVVCFWFSFVSMLNTPNAFGGKET